jgi:hypothetical protein
MTDGSPDSDVTLGEVNRNLRDFKEDIKGEIRGIRDGFVSKETFLALQREVQELKESARFRLGSWISTAGIVISAGVAIWAVVHEGGGA